MNELVTCGFFCLIVDAVLTLCLWAGLVLLRCPGCGPLVGLWTFGVVKWVLLHVYASMLAEGKPRAVLSRLVALLCLLPPVVESGRFLTADSSEAHMGRGGADLSALLMGSVASAVACVFWENLFCGDGKKRDADTVNSKQLLTRLLKYCRPDTLHLIAAFSFLILAVMCDSLIPLYQGKVIDMLGGQTAQSSFCYSIGQLALLSLGSALFSGLRGGIFMCSLARLNKRLKHLLFHTLLQQDVNFFDENKPGPLSSRLHSDVDRMGRTVALNSNLLVRSTVRTGLMLKVMLGLSWELTLLTCIEMPLVGLVQNKYSTLSKAMKDQIQDCQAQNSDLASQTIGGIRTVRSFRAESDEVRRYNKALDQMSRIRRRSRVCSAVFLLMRRVVTLTIKILMLLQARSLISSDRLSVGNLVTFFLYQKPMSQSLQELLYCYGETVSTMGVISKVFSYIDRKPKSQKAGDLAPEKLRGRVSFQDVTFSYPSAAPGASVLKSVSMELQPGKVTALVGPSGSGKTSCVSLLKRLYEPQEGQILLDGEPLHRYDHKFLHQQVALVSQNPVLFSGSLRYNIEYGLRDCSIEKIREVAKKINVDEFILELKDEYDTDIGECGSKLSDGLKQCIAIIRALVRDPRVIVLDEATSKLDVKAQHTVLPEILSRGRTVLVVAHQLKTVEEADHIIFMENGVVVEQGTHRELMAQGGRYHRLREELFSSPAAAQD
ncbi:antigen peptide transporter 2 [Platichthys flesus]|uniref:antigen peptide transporter 2 n=1 Tax=Platichthys flesus TaxID=8260 RepID=UPI002DBFCD9D|nr:antigen peptide transporter 2 [Platichthys flesus]XP_062270256.1 antigen peptide transporter 2 [Platichthys flesus]